MIGWVDVETTGLNPEHGALLEVGIVLTEDNLLEIGRRAVVVKPETKWKFVLMEPAVRTMHTENHLLDEVGTVGLPLAEGEEVLMRWLASAVGDRDEDILMAGSSVHFDRAWLKRRMPDLHDLFHYRNLDVSTLKELNRRWPFADSWDGDRKAHRALPDIDDSITEFKTYLHAIRESTLRNRETG